MKVKLYRHYSGYYTDSESDVFYNYRIVKSLDGHGWSVDYPSDTILVDRLRGNTVMTLPIGMASRSGFKTLKEAKSFIEGL